MLTDASVGHFSKECPEPKDWNKVKCSNCGESMGPSLDLIYDD